MVSQLWHYPIAAASFLMSSCGRVSPDIFLTFRSFAMELRGNLSPRHPTESSRQPRPGSPGFGQVTAQVIPACLTPI
jgi:hypothetical protein